MRKWLLYLLIVLSYVSTVWAADAAVVDLSTATGEYIREWLVLGPFSADGLEKDFLADVGGEANIRPSEGMSFKAPGGETYVWKRHKSQPDYINLQDVMKQSLFSANRSRRLVIGCGVLVLVNVILVMTKVTMGRSLQIDDNDDDDLQYLFDEQAHEFRAAK